MKTLHVNLQDRGYDILIKKGLLADVGKHIKERFSPDKIFVVTDDNVNNLYGDQVVTALEKEGYTVKLISLSPGEQTKCMESLSYLYSEALSFSITRSDMVVALGGGVIGDLAGFMAATLLRGIPFVQIPTTLLAQVDSSVGGKVAIDVSEGKNLVGAFYQPKLVLIDTDVLCTLSDTVFSDGLAEVIKYGFIADRELFELLNSCKKREDVYKNIESIVYTCCDIKRRIVEQDEHDTGIRMILNFGHTLGHVAEKEYNYQTYTHGQAVAFGMHLITRIGEKIGLTPSGVSDSVTSILKKFNLPCSISLSDKIGETISHDKKSLGDDINIVLLSGVGQAFTHKMPVAEFVSLAEAELVK